MSRRVSAKVKRSVVFLAAGGALVGSAIWLAALPRDTDALETLASRSLEAREPRRALESLDLAIEQVGSDSPADRERRFDLLIKRGRVNLGPLDRPEHALSDFREAQALEPGEPRAWDDVGAALLGLNRYADAARHFEEAAAAFPDRERWFRYAAACAHWRQSREFEMPAEAMIRLQTRPGREHDLDRALEVFSSSGPYRQTQEEIEATLIRPPRGTAEVRQGFELLLQARAEFVKADRQMADYEVSPELSPRFGRVRLEMHRQAGRYYELCRTAELLLQCPRDPRDWQEIVEIQTLRADALHDLGRFSAAADAFIAHRDMCSTWKEQQVALEGAQLKRFQAGLLDAMVLAQFRLIDEEVIAGRNREALAQLAWFGEGKESPGWLPFHLHNGVLLHLNGRDAEAIEPLEHSASLLLDPTNDCAWAFRDPVERRLQVGWLADALLGAGRAELANRIYDQLLESSPDSTDFLVGRAAALRARGDHLWETVNADFELLKLGRDGGRRLATWEADWLAFKGKPAQLAKSVAEQSIRVQRLFSSDTSPDKTTSDLVQAAMKARTKAFVLPTAKDTTIETAGFALLRGLEAEPALVLQVYRNLVEHGFRDQAFLLLYGLVEAQPAVADFRLLLARHDLADGRLEDALAVLEALRNPLPEDDEITALAAATARRFGDVAHAHRIEEAALGDTSTGPALLLAVRGCLADGYPELVLAAARGATVESASGRGLLGLAARAKNGLGDAAGAESLAQEVLAKEPTQRDALAALLLVGVSRKEADGTSACDAWIAANEALLAGLDADSLAEIGRAVLAAGGATPAEHLLRLALARDATHATARLALADALLVLRRFDDLDPILDPARLEVDDVEATRRLALRALLRDGATAANSFLVDRVAIGAPEAGLARWIGLTGAAAGRIGVSFEVLERRKVVLDATETRLLALCATAWNARPEEVLLLPAVAALAHVATDATSRDRELERLVSLDLASAHHHFLEELVTLDLLDAVGELAPLRDAERAKFHALNPSPGALALDEATRRREAGDAAGAAALLFAQISDDPHDLDALHALTACAEHLPAEQLEETCDVTPRSGAAPGLVKIFAALREDVRGDTAAALAQLTEAAEDPQSRAPALLVRIRLLARADAQSAVAPSERPPWCEAGDRERIAATERDGDDLLAGAAAASPADPLVLAAVRQRLRTASGRIEPKLRDLFVATLVTQHEPWFEAYEAAIAAAGGTTPPDRAQVESLGQSFDAALNGLGGGTLPLAAVRALVLLAERARAAEMNDAAQRWLDRAAAACPLHPELLAAQGRIALAAGDERTTRRCFTRASRFGSEAQDLLHWLGRDALQAGRPEEARADELRALASAPAADHAARAEMDEVLARACFLLDDGDGAKRAWRAAATERGEDPDRSLPIALETFARGGPAAAKGRLEPIAATAGPAQEIAKALLKIAVALETAEPAKVQTPSAAPDGSQRPKRRVRGGK